MPHTLVLEKSRPRPEDSRNPKVQKTPDDGSLEPFVYLLLPHAAGYQVMRTPLRQLLEISEAVSDVPRSDAADSSGRSDLFDKTSTAKGIGFDAEDIARMQGMVEKGVHSQCVRFGEIDIDVAARAVTRDGNTVPLAPLEFDLLLALFQRKGAAVSREELMRELWKRKDADTSRTVDTHIFNLRRKLECDPAQPVHLLTVSKIGYRLKT